MLVILICILYRLLLNLKTLYLVEMSNGCHFAESFVTLQA